MKSSSRATQTPRAIRKARNERAFKVQRAPLTTIDFAQSERERALNMPAREIKYQRFVGRGYTGAALRAIRASNGVGRPPYIAALKALKIPFPQKYSHAEIRRRARNAAQ